MEKTYMLTVLRTIDGNEQVRCDRNLNWMSRGLFQRCEECSNFTDIQKHNVQEVEKLIIGEFNSLSKNFNLVDDSIFLYLGPESEPIYDVIVRDNELSRSYKTADPINPIDNLAIKISVTEEGFIIKSCGPIINDYFHRRNRTEIISDYDFDSIAETIALVVERLPKFISIPMKNGEPVGMELANSSFYLGRK